MTGRVKGRFILKTNICIGTWILCVCSVSQVAHASEPKADIGMRAVALLSTTGFSAPAPAVEKEPVIKAVLRDTASPPAIPATIAAGDKVVEKKPAAVIKAKPKLEYSFRRDGIPTRSQRQQIKAIPIENRPYRPMHFYGNTVRRRAR